MAARESSTRTPPARCTGRWSVPSRTTSTSCDAAESGDAVLIDAANEHDHLLERVPRPRRALGGRDPRPLGPHPGRPAGPRGGDRGWPSRPGRRDAALLRPAPRRRRRDQGGRSAAPHRRHAGPHAGLDVLRVGGTPVLLQRRHALPRRPGRPRFEGGDFATIIASIEDRLFAAFDDGTMVLPGHGDSTTSAPSGRSLEEWVDRGW